MCTVWPLLRRENLWNLKFSLLLQHTVWHILEPSWLWWAVTYFTPWTNTWKNWRGEAGGRGGDEGEGTRKVESWTRKQFMAVGKAYVATFWPTSGLKGRTFVSSGISPQGDPNFCIHSTLLHGGKNWKLLFLITWKKKCRQIRCLLMSRLVHSPTAHPTPKAASVPRGIL